MLHRLLLATAGLGLLAGCRPATRASLATGGCGVRRIRPVAYLAEQIGGQHVTVGMFVRPGQDPHTFEPTPQQGLGAASRAAVFFKVGMPFEDTRGGKGGERNPRLPVVDTTEGIRKRAIDKPSHRAGGDDIPTGQGTRLLKASPIRTSGSRPRC